MVLELLIDLRLVVEANAGPEEIPFVLLCLLDALAVQDLLQDFGFGIDKFE